MYSSGPDPSQPEEHRLDNSETTDISVLVLRVKHPRAWPTLVYGEGLPMSEDRSTKNKRVLGATFTFTAFLHPGCWHLVIRAGLMT